jgi:hypothetical protein
MGDGIGAHLATNNPTLRAATSEQGTKVISVNQNPTVLRQENHLFWGAGGIELTPQLWVSIHPIKEVIQSIQKWRWRVIHAWRSGTTERYQGISKPQRKTTKKECLILWFKH